MMMRGKRREKREKTEEGRLKTEICRLKNAIFILGFISVFLFSCQDVKKPVKPADLILKEKMIDILSDVYISNAARNVNNKLIREKDLQLDSLIYAKYEIDSLQFAKSNEFYSADLLIYSNLLTEVQTRLNVLKIEKDSLFEIAKKEDSINKSKEKKAPKVEANTLIKSKVSN